MSPRHLALAILVVFIWGFNFVVIKIGLGSIPPILFSCIRFVCAACPLIFFVKRPAVDWRYVVGYGLIQFAMQFGLLFVGMKLGMSAGLTSIVIQLQAFITVGLAVLFLAERPTRMQILGGLFGLCGMLLVGIQLESRSTLVGFALVLTAAVAWSCANLLTKRMGPVDPLSLVTWGSLVAAPVLFVLSLTLEGAPAIEAALRHLDWRAWAAIFYQSYPNTIVGFGIWAVLVRRYSAATVAPFSLMIPIIGLASGALLLGEPMPWWEVAAGLMVLSGLGLNQWDIRRRARLA